MSYQVNREKWAKQTIFEQMGNIYSEVGRSINAKSRGDNTGSQLAVERALDLFDATSEHLVKIRSPKNKEVLRAKEQYLNTITADELDSIQINDLDRYFLQFAIASRLNRI